MYTRYKEALLARGVTEKGTKGHKTLEAMTFRTVVFLGSSREGRMGDRVMKMVCKVLAKRNHDVTILGEYWALVLARVCAIKF
jgi:urease gamma subunit